MKGSCTDERLALGGLVHRRRCWLPTTLGWLVLLGGAFCAGFLTLSRLNAFLCVNEPVSADVLVVEGWLKDSSLKQVVQETKARVYRRVLTTGGPVEHGLFLRRYGSWAEVAALSLRKMGAQAGEIDPIPCVYVRRNRTYESAVAVRNWIQEHGGSSVNVVTDGPHARRTRLVYEHVLGPKFRVGIIPVSDGEYDPRRWWRSGRGAQVVFYEAFAYLYAVSSER